MLTGLSQGSMIVMTNENLIDCLGDTLTLADTFLPAQVFNENRFGVDRSQFPNIVFIMENLNKIAEFVKAHASGQPDAYKWPFF